MEGLAGVDPDIHLKVSSERSAHHFWKWRLGYTQTAGGIKCAPTGSPPVCAQLRVVRPSAEDPFANTQYGIFTIVPCAFTVFRNA